jgi:hypothetical protein
MFSVKRIRKLPWSQPLGIAATFIAAALPAGCGNQDGGGLPTTETDSAVAVLTRACSPDSCSHYLSVLPELPASGVLDRSQSLEFGDAQGSIFNDAIYIFEFENQRVQRFALDEEGQLQRGPVLSFQGLGLTVVAGILNAWVGPERAFLLDPASGQIVTWDPTDMVVIATTPIPDEFLARAGRAADFTWPGVVGSRVFYNVNWYDWETHQSSGGLALLVFDATSDTPAPILVEDERCAANSTVAPFAGSAGHVYAAGDGMGGEMTVLTADGPEACALRTATGTLSFDGGYRLDLRATPDVLAFSVGWPLPGADAMVAKVWAPSSPPPLPLDEPDAYVDTNEFAWVIIDLATGEVRPVAIPPGGWGNLTPLELDGVRYVQSYPPKADGDAYPEAFLYAIDRDGGATQVLRAGASSDFEMLGRIHRPDESR